MHNFDNNQTRSDTTSSLMSASIIERSASFTQNQKDERI